MLRKKIYDFLSLFQTGGISHADLFPTFQKKIGGVTVNFARTGKGRPLVFIHGWTNNWEGWIPNVKYLEKHFSLYLLDMPGFGHSSDLKSYSVQKTADIIARFIKKTIRKKVSLAAVSMGSFVAADLTLRYPHLIKNTILTGAVINDGRHTTIPKAVNKSLKFLNKSPKGGKILKKAIETRAAAYLFGKYLNMYKFNKKIIDDYGMIGKKLVRKNAYIQMGISAFSYNLENTLKNVKRPLLLILGDKDIYTSYIYVMKNILPANKNLTLKVLKDAGHVTPWEKPKEVAYLINKFTK